MKKLLPTLIAGACLAFGPPAFAQTGFPSRPVKMIVPYPAGGGGDILARAIADVFARTSGQPMIIENRAGANGMVGASACKNAPADGYTYCLPVSDVMAINPHIYKSVPYSVDKDFTVVAPVATVVLAFLVNSEIPVNDLKELAAWSRQNRNKANFATWGIGSAAHLALTKLNQSLHADLTNVPYPGVPQMLQATLTQDAAATLLFYGPVASYIASGKLKPLAVLASQRYPALPKVPTLAEEGVDFSPTVYYGVYAPAGAPAAIVERMGQLITTSAADPQVRKIMDAQGFAPLVETPKAFSERVAKDRAAWGPIAKSLNLLLE